MSRCDLTPEDDREPPPGHPYWHCREHPGVDGDCPICEANETAANSDVSQRIRKLEAERAETIEVLEQIKRLDWYSASFGLNEWRIHHAKPLLDKLKGES